GGADVVNTGDINVSAKLDDAGQVVVLGENVTHTGAIHADSESQRAGQIELHAMDKTELRDNALISAQTSQSGKGGAIKLLGDKIGLFDQAEVNASGIHGGGEILVGGDRQGLNSNIRNAEFLYLGEASQLFADAIIDGNGGRIITYANDTGRFYGGIYARGGAQGGDGGFIETSGKKGFELPRAPDVSAVAGDGGLWLIDPYDIRIGYINAPGSYDEDTTNSPDTSYTSLDPDPIQAAEISVSVIETALGAGDVEIITDSSDSGGQAGNISFDADLDYRDIGTGKTLTLNADGGITFELNSFIHDTNNSPDSLNINLYANGGILLNGGVNIETNGGDFTVGFVDQNTPANSITPTTFTNNGIINTSGIDSPDYFTAPTNAGDISITVSGAINSGTLTAKGGKNLATDNYGSAINGADGGAITISADSITITGSLDSSGSLKRFENDVANSNPEGVDNAINGAGGQVTLNATNASTGTKSIIVNNGVTITTKGGDFIVGDINRPTTFTNNGEIVTTGISAQDDGSIDLGDRKVAPGNAGIISITASGTVTSGTLTAKGGENVVTDNVNDSKSIDGAAGGAITIDAGSGIISNVVDSSGSAARFDSNTNSGGANGGNGGAIIITANSGDISTLGIITNGGNGAGDGNETANGGNAGNITLSSLATLGLVTLNGDITATGGTAFYEGIPGTKSNIVIDGTLKRTSDLTITANSFTSGNIDAKGVQDAAGKNITITADTFITTGSINTQAGAPTQMATPVDGNDGGEVTLNAADITVGAITTKGSNAVVGTPEPGTGAGGGDGGVVTITAEDDGGTPSITLNGDIMTAAGNGVGNGGSGTAGTPVITLKGSGGANGTLTIGSGVTFTEKVIVTSNTNGSETVTVTDGTHDWQVTGSNTGTLTNTNLKFNNFENLTGGTGRDRFVFWNGGSLDGLITGGDGFSEDTVDMFRLGTVAVTLGQDITGIETIVGNYNDSTLTATNSANSWNITGYNTGSVDGVKFFGFTDLTGGTGDDDFTVASGATLNGAIDGGGGTGTNTLTQADGTNTWGITGADRGTLTDITSGFSNIQNLTGGSGDDDFTVASGATLNGAIKGGTGTNTLTQADGNNDWRITGVDRGTLTDITSGFGNIQRLTGGSGDDDFIFTL
ncbi:MAG: hypothetical protein GY779_11975, partial [Gammaproteobacteria bacterium]|nr:hypothetical protein [Gammaproteobacteria bacterium]